MSKNVSFLGAGNMGGALIEGAIKKGFLKAGQISVFDVDATKSADFKNRLKVKAASSVREAVKGSDYIFLCVKPQQMDNVLKEVSGAVNAAQCLVSIAAGVTTEGIQKGLGAKSSPRVVRVMPNTPAMVGSGMSAVTGGKGAKPEDLEFCKSFFEAVGEVEILEEKYFDAVTAVSGSGPAYLFYLAEALQQAAADAGLPRKAAEKLARVTLQGAAKLLDDKTSPAELRRRVTSPGGTTEAAIRHLENQNWQKIFIDAVHKAKERSAQLRGAQS